MAYYDLKNEGIDCTKDYLYYLKEKINILDLYYNYIKTPWPSCLTNNDYRINYAVHNFIISENNMETPSCEKITRLKYKIYGDQKIYFNICPFHINDSDTYCFLVDNTANLFYCLGCDIVGNNFDFLMQVYDLDLLSATKILATIDLLTRQHTNEQFIKEEISKLGIPYNLSEEEWKIFFHLTRQNISFELKEKSIKKMQKLFERVDTYIEKQYKTGRLDDEIKQYFKERFAKNKNDIIFLNKNYEYERLLEKMSNRICVSKILFKERLINRK